MEPERFIINAPPYFDLNTSHIKSLKSIILPTFDRSNWSDDEIKSLEKKISLLLEQGFQLYYLGNDSLEKIEIAGEKYKYSLSYHTIIEQKIRGLSTQDILLKLKSTSDQVFFMTESLLKELINEEVLQLSENGIVALTYAGFKQYCLQFGELLETITLEADEKYNSFCQPNPTNEMAEFVLPKLHSLTINIKFDINTILTSILRAAPNLERLDLFCYVPGTELDINHLSQLQHLKCLRIRTNLLPFEILQNVLQDNRNLEELRIFDFPEKLLNKPLVLPNLKKICFGGGDLNLAALKKLLDHSQLKSLTFDFGTKISGDPTLKLDFLANLDTLIFDYCDIDEPNLIQFLTQASQLRKLEIKRSVYTKNNFVLMSLEPIHLSYLKNFEISSVKVNFSSLQNFLKHAQSLETLILNQISLDKNIHLLQPFVLPNLKKLRVFNTQCSATVIQAILTNSQQIEEIEIDGCEELLDDLLTNLHLPKLRKLSLKSSTFSAKFLQKILQGSKALEDIDFLGITMEGEFEEIDLELNHLTHFKLVQKMMSSHSLSSKALAAILKGAKKLQILELERPEPLLAEELNGVDLSDLQQFSINRGDIEFQALLLLLSKASHLTHLILNSCSTSKNEPTSCKPLNLPNLREIKFAGCEFPGILLTELLREAEQLEILELEYWEIRKLTDTFRPLPALKQLILKYNFMSVASLQSLLNQAVSLNKLELLNACKDEKSIKWHSVNFSHLKGIKLYGNYSQDALIKLLLQAEQLVSCELGKINIELPSNVLDQMNWLKLLKLDLENCKTHLPTLLALLSKTPNMINLRVQQLEFKDLESLINLDIDALPFNNGVKRPLKELKNYHKDKKEETDFLVEKRLTQEKHITYKGLPIFYRDANTSYNPRQKNLARQIFIGKPYSPLAFKLRLDAYDKFILNTEILSEQYPFIAVNSKYKALWSIIKVYPIRSKNPLFEEYQKKGDKYYLGRMVLPELNSEWQRIPSIAGNETLKSFYLDSNIEVEIVKSDRDGFHYIRSKSSILSRSFNLEILLKVPETDNELYSRIPPEVRDIATFCRGFAEGDLDISFDTKDPAFWLKALKEQKKGACRHRTDVFMDLMQEKHPLIPVQIIENSIHSYPEIKIENEWLPLDLGGYDTDVILDNSSFPEVKDDSNQTRDAFKNPERDYKIKFSNHGLEIPNGYMRRAKNITCLELNQYETFPQLENPGILDTLIIKDCILTKKSLSNFLLQTPKLKTLKISHCTMSEGDFKSLDFSMLTELEQIEITGNFIPDTPALNKLISTASKKAKWSINSPNVTEEAFIDKTQLKVNAAKRKMPSSRYFPKSNKQQPFSVATNSVKKVIIDSSSSAETALFMQKELKQLGKDFFYVDSPEFLECSQPFIKKDDKGKGIIRRGPGGPYYDFIQKYPEGTTIVNYGEFKASDIARFNTLLDETRSIDGIAISKDSTIIGVMDKSDPASYDGADFYSRFKQKTIFSAHYKEEPIAWVEEVKPNQHVIELCGSASWSAKLIGHWVLKGKLLEFKEGDLLQALKAGHKDIILNNPPIHSPDFIAFLQQSRLHQAVVYRHEHLMPLPADFNLSFRTGIEFPDKEQRILFSEQTDSMADHKILNTSTLSRFLGIYEVDPALNTELQLLAGYIENYAQKTLPIYLTETLTELDWLRLFEYARKYQVQFEIIAADSITLPSCLNDKNKLKKYALPSMLHTLWIVGASAIPQIKETDVIAIDVSELTISELLGGLNGRFDKEKLEFIFGKYPNFLEEMLEKEKTIVLKGPWPKEIAQALHPLLLKRAAAENPKGKLILCSEGSQSFPLLTPQWQPDIDKEAFKIDYSQAYYAYRFYRCEQALKKYPFIFLNGPTGTGKTTFFKKVWKKRYPACHYGEDQILAWLEDDSQESFITLFIDEANLAGRHWSEFYGLKADSPGVFYKGTYYPLTKRHKVIFAGNGDEYGGERQKPRLFEESHARIEFKALPLKVIFQDFKLPLEVEAPIRKLINFLEDLKTKELIITPRELLMMAIQAQACSEKYNQYDVKSWADYFVYHLTLPHMPGNFRQNFIEQFEPQTKIQFPTIELNNFVINPSNQRCFDALSAHLDAREFKKKTGITEGLGGLIFEGEPGLGKSVLLVKFLQAKGLVVGKDFIHIPVSLNQQEKEARLLEAFHKGLIVIIDEINSSPMLERVMNAVLEGQDLKGNPAVTPGFLVLGTQNPTTYSGRQQTTLPLQHRLEKVIIPNYSEAEMLSILKHKGLPPRIAQDMLAEFIVRKNEDKSYCFRDLDERAQQWLKDYENEKPIIRTMRSQPQVGQICKLVSLSNIEQYYKDVLSFGGLPLHKNGKKDQTSIRGLAKKLGSVQGEILEFGLWQNLVEEMGYDSEIAEFGDDINLFQAALVSHLKAGNFPMLAFAVMEDSGHPDPEPKDAQTREHATVITGYDFKTDEVTIVHWGATYKVDLVTLFNSNRVLSNTRGQEFYDRNRLFQPGGKTIAKYVSGKTTGERASIIPKEMTGFRSKMLVVKRPDLQRLEEKRVIKQK